MISCRKSFREVTSKDLRKQSVTEARENEVDILLLDSLIRRGSSHSVADLESSIWEYMEASNENSRPFSWTAQPDKILAKVAKARAALDNIHD